MSTTSVTSHLEAAKRDLVAGVPSEFEFSPAQEGMFRDLGRKMRIVGAFFVLAGLMRLIYDALVLHEVHLDLTFIIDVLIGVWTLSAARSFRRVAEAGGQDVERMLEGLSDIRKLYSLIYWLLIVSVFVAVVALLSGLTPGDISFRIR
jgi:hypothetical protein